MARKKTINGKQVYSINERDMVEKYTEDIDTLEALEGQFNEALDKEKKNVNIYNMCRIATTRLSIMDFKHKVIEKLYKFSYSVNEDEKQAGRNIALDTIRAQTDELEEGYN